MNGESKETVFFVFQSVSRDETADVFNMDASSLVTTQKTRIDILTAVRTFNRNDNII